MTKQKTISIFLILALTVTIFGFGVFSSKSAAKAVIEEDFEEQIFPVRFLNRFD